MATWFKTAKTGNNPEVQPQEDDTVMIINEWQLLIPTWVRPNKKFWVKRNQDKEYMRHHSISTNFKNIYN